MLNKSDYIEEVNNITEKGNEQGKYIETIYTTYNDFKHFQNFLYRSFKKSEYCDQMRQNSNQPGRFFQTAKRHKFPSLNDIIIGKLKLRPVIDLKETYIYDHFQRINTPSQTSWSYWTDFRIPTPMLIKKMFIIT